MYKDELIKNSDQITDLELTFNFDSTEGYLTAKRIAENLDYNIKEASILLCGPTQMMHSLRKQFMDMGLDSEMCLDSLSEEDSLFLKTKTFDLPYTPKKIENIAVHITDSRKPIKNSTEKFWKDFFYNVKYPGSYMVGYNYLISYDKVLYLRPINRDSFLQKSEIVWGVANHNSRTVSIAIEGGRIYDNKNKKWIVGLDTRSNRQKFLLDSLLKDIKTFNPNAKIKGHNQFSGVKKSCPNYKVK